MKVLKKILKQILLTAFFVFILGSNAFAEDFNTLAQNFNGKTIAVITGSTCEQIAQECFPDSNYAYYDTITDAYLALSSGKVDAYLENEPALSYMDSVSHNIIMIEGDFPVEHLATMFVKSPRGEKLLSQFNKYVGKLYDNGRIDELKQKWVYGQEDGRTPLDYETLPDINGTLHISTDPTFPPLEYIKDGRLAGYEVEIVTGFCREYGYKPEYDIVSFSGSISGVFTGKYDMAVSGLAITPERQKQAMFSRAIYESNVVLALPSEPQETTFVQKLSGIADSFNSTFVTENRWQMLARGLLVTLAITLSSIVFGSAIGFGIYLVTRKNNRAAVAITRVAKVVIQGFPMVVLLMVLYYIIFGKSSLSSTWVAIIAFSLTFACSMHGMLEGGEAAIDHGQYEAAYSLGYKETQAFFRYILPQSALHFLPDFKSEAVSHLKATAIVGYVAVVDLTKAGDIIRGRTYEAIFPLLAVSLVYFAISFIIGKVVDGVIYSVDTKNRSSERILKGLVIK